MRPLKGMLLKDDGSLVKEFSDTEVFIALSTIVKDVIEKDSRFVVFLNFI